MKKSRYLKHNKNLKKKRSNENISKTTKLTNFDEPRTKTTKTAKTQRDKTQITKFGGDDASTPE